MAIAVSGPLPVSRLRVLSLSSTYPTPWQPGLGTFVRARLRQLTSFADLKVVAPVAVVEFGNPTRRGLQLRPLPQTEADGKMDVLRPLWIYPPLGGGLNGVLLFLQLLRPLARVRKSFRFQVIDAHFGHPDGVAAGLLAWVFRCPFTLTLRGNETFHAQYQFRRAVLRWTIRRATRVITVSERLRQFAIRCGAHPDRTVSIPNGVDTALFYPRSQSQFRQDLGLRRGDLLIVSAGALIERKGHHHLIDAISALRARGIPAHLAIAGGPGSEGDFAQTLRRQVAKLSLGANVHFVGHLHSETLAECMSSADVVCLASSREGWPNVVNEALACGAPVVATDIGGVPDMLISEEYGIIVPVSDQAALEAALDRALRTRWDRTAIAEWGQKRSWTVVAEDVMRVFREALAPFTVGCERN